MNVERKVAVVTGAGSGIGRETSLQLAQAGYHLMLVSRSRDKLETTARLAAKDAATGVDVDVRPTDLCNAQHARNVATQTLKRFGRLDAVANVAGYAPLVPIKHVTADMWQKVVDTNLSSVVNLTAAAWPMLKQRGGIVVNVSSMASVDPFPGLAIYAAAKAGLNMLTRSTAQEGQEEGIRAVAVAPGAVETPMLRSLFDESAIGKHQTLDPKAVAKVIVDCITGDRSFEPGQTILLPSPQ